jgi:hypothetical protein
LAQDVTRLPDGPERRKALDTFEAILATISERYNQETPGAQVRGLRYVRCAVAVRFAEIGAPVCEQLFSLETKRP